MSTLSVDTIQGQTTAANVKLPAGSVIQTQRTYIAEATDTTAKTTSTSLVASGIQCTITPRFSNSLILVDFHSGMANSGSSDIVKAIMYLKIGSASIAAMPGSNQYHIGFQRYDKARYSPFVFSGSYTATSTDTLVFEPYFHCQFGNNAVHLIHDDGSISLTATEISQ